MFPYVHTVVTLNFRTCTQFFMMFPYVHIVFMFYFYMCTHFLPYVSECAYSYNVMFPYERCAFIHVTVCTHYVIIRVSAVYVLMYPCERCVRSYMSRMYEHCVCSYILVSALCVSLCSRILMFMYEHCLFLCSRMSAACYFVPVRALSVLMFLHLFLCSRMSAVCFLLFRNAH